MSAAQEREDDPMIPGEKARVCPLCLTPMTDGADHEYSAPHQRAAETQRELWLTRFAVFWLAGLLVIAGLRVSRTALMVAGLAGVPSARLPGYALGRWRYTSDPRPSDRSGSGHGGGLRVDVVVLGGLKIQDIDLIRQRLAAAQKKTVDDSELFSRILQIFLTIRQEAISGRAREGQHERG